jgi:hypothetical protein
MGKQHNTASKQQGRPDNARRSNEGSDRGDAQRFAGMSDKADRAIDDQAARSTPMMPNK